MVCPITSGDHNDDGIPRADIGVEQAVVADDCYEVCLVVPCDARITFV